MPTAVNGIGTHYYGKKNLDVRTAPCRFCRRVGGLRSYDTRLWFVVVFIPVIPLGRKRIIDECPSCTKHMVANAAAYEQARQLAVSASLEQFRSDPSSDAALQAHANLLAFHEHEQAAAFRASALERFPDHAGLRVGLASQLVQASAFEPAVALFEEALELEPDLPEARVGVARRKMAIGELDEARDLLDFLEEPGAGQHHPLGPIDVLSDLYQKQGRHEEALALAEVLLREIPQAGRQHAFRSFVQKSEKALGRMETMLPPMQHSLRGIFHAEGSPYPPWARKLTLAGVVVGLLAAGLLLNNEYIRRHRTIHVVNACGKPVQVRVDDGPPRSIDTLGRLDVAEGRHRLRLSGAVDETRDVDVRDSFFRRWTHTPLWALNPGGEAVFDDVTLYYARQPPPARHRLIVGTPFVTAPHVDYAFVDPPNQLKLEKGGGQVEKIAFRWFRGRDDEAFQAALATDREGAFAFAERRLRRFPDQKALFDQYLGQVLTSDRPRGIAFLKSGLDRRPVLVTWHRAYQTLAGGGGDDKDLVALYDRYLASEPSSAALLYLRGRVEPDPARERDYFRRASEADPRLPWPWLSLAREAEAKGDWGESLRLLRKADGPETREERLDDLLHVARLATGDAESLVRDDQARLRANPTDPNTMILLGESLAASGRPERITAELNAWSHRLPPEQRDAWVRPVRAISLYQAGKFAECEQLCRTLPGFQSGPLRVHALLAQGKAGQVAADATFARAWDDPYCLLAESLGLDLAGEPEEAARWRERACRELETLTADTRRVAKALEAPGPVPLDVLDRVYVGPEQRALIFAVLAARFPAKRAEYLAAAARFNVRRKPSYALVRRAIEGAGPAAP
jgi:tetratricopeptide (TPR) repeat protein